MIRYERKWILSNSIANGVWGVSEMRNTDPEIHVHWNSNQFEQ